MFRQTKCSARLGRTDADHRRPAKRDTDRGKIVGEIGGNSGEDTIRPSSDPLVGPARNRIQVDQIDRAATPDGLRNHGRRDETPEGDQSTPPRLLLEDPAGDPTSPPPTPEERQGGSRADGGTAGGSRYRWPAIRIEQSPVHRTIGADESKVDAGTVFPQTLGDRDAGPHRTSGPPTREENGGIDRAHQPSPIARDAVSGVVASCRSDTRPARRLTPHARRSIDITSPSEKAVSTQPVPP